RDDVARRQVLDRLSRPEGQLQIRPFAAAGRAWSRAAVADTAAVARWRAALGSAAPRCRAVVPDYLALPGAPGLWTVQQGEDGVRVRLGRDDGFSAEPALARQMLLQALAQARAANALPRAVLMPGRDEHGLAALFEGIAIARDPSDLPQGIVPAIFAHGEATVDFARDPRADAAVVEHALRRLVWPLALLLLGALGWAGSMILMTRHDLAAARALTEATVSAAQRDILPPGPVLDLRVQVAREIERRRAAADPQGPADGPIEVMRLGAQVLAGADATVETLSFGPGTDGVSVGVRVADFRALDAVSEALSAAGLTVRIARSGTDPDGGVTADLLLAQGGRP
ncbi:type II secretion system protein L, partial [Pararhodobacter sp.]